MKTIRKLLNATLAAGIAFSPMAAEACTSFVLRDKDQSYVYARTMEFGKSIDERLVLYPRGYGFQGTGPDGVPGSGLTWKARNAVVGINAFELDLLVDGMNEKGMSGGILNLPNSAEYQNPTGDEAKNSIASYQMLNWALSNFDNTDQVREALPKIFVHGAPLKQWNGTVKIHMTLHDMQGKSIVVEYVDGGTLKIYDNPNGTMANDPPFDWHLANLGNYVNLSPVEVLPKTVDGVTFRPPSSGSGLHGLPGDFLSPSRFLRAFEYSQAAQKYAADQPRVELAWHIVNMFDIPPGSVMIPAGDPYAGGEAGWEYTQETIVTDPKNLTYYFRPFTTLNIQKFDLKSADLDAKDKKVWELSTSTTYTDVK